MAPASAREVVVDVGGLECVRGDGLDPPSFLSVVGESRSGTQNQQQQHQQQIHGGDATRMGLVADRVVGLDAAVGDRVSGSGGEERRSVWRISRRSKSRKKESEPMYIPLSVMGSSSSSSLATLVSDGGHENGSAFASAYGAGTNPEGVRLTAEERDRERVSGTNELRIRVGDGLEEGTVRSPSPPPSYF
jgi:hypothetical protein